MDTLYWLAVATVVVVLIFDYTNGFHDASNIVATVIASRAMTPVQAVLVVGFFEFMGPLLGGTAVANTIGKFVDLSTVDASSSHFKPTQGGCWRRLAHEDWQTWAMKIEGNSGCY